MNSKRLFSTLVSFAFCATPIVSRGMFSSNIESNNINNDIEDSKEQENEKCAICYHPLSKKDDDLKKLHDYSIKLKCGHTFGYGCLQAYLAELVKKNVRNIKSQSIFKLSCPLCKREANIEDVKELLNTRNLFSNYPAEKNSEFYEKLATSLARRCCGQEKVLNKKTSKKDYRALEKEYNEVKRNNKYLKEELKRLKVEEREWRSDCFRKMDENAELKQECENLKEKYEINEHSNELSRWLSKAALLVVLGTIGLV